MGGGQPLLDSSWIVINHYPQFKSRYYNVMKYLYIEMTEFSNKCLLDYHSNLAVVFYPIGFS